MTAPAEAPARGAAGGPPDRATGTTAGRRWRAPVLWAVLVLLLALALTLVALGQQRTDSALDPDNAGRDGARALTQVLRDHGVQVSVVRSQSALLHQPIGAGTTLFLTDADQLSARTAARAAAHAARADRIVVLDGGRAVIRGLRLPVETGPGTYQRVAAACESPDVRPGDEVSQGQVRYAPHDDVAATVCFPQGDGRSEGGYYVTLPAGPDRPEVALLGSDAVLTNSSITQADNAGLAVRALGHSPRLVWYVANIDDIAADDPTSVPALLPTWLRPALLLVGSAVLALILWRGRRLGRLVTEPLPVVVRAAETTESRGRLYRRAGDRGRAVAVLQAASRRRLSAHLGLPRGTTPRALAQAVAAATGRHTDDVAWLLGEPAHGPLGGAAPDDTALMWHANQLAQLEEEVRHR